MLIPYIRTVFFKIRINVFILCTLNTFFDSLVVLRLGNHAHALQRKTGTDGRTDGQTRRDETREKATTPASERACEGARD